MAWNINFDVLKRVEGNGRKCICNLSDNCPCTKFIHEQICKCGAFRKVEE